MARALVRQPKVFLFDEPLSNLDAQLRTEMRSEIKKLHEKLRTTIVYVTHDQIEAMTMATKIAIMQDGNVMQYGSPDEIYRAPANLFVAKFVGFPTINLIKASIGFSGNAASLRLLESAAAADGSLKPFAGDTDIFITPGYRFKCIDLLMTNFHLPKSTLFMLVCAFAGMERMKSAYGHAIKQGYRFFSYGDSSLLERAE